VTKANGILKVFVTASILAGIAAAGPTLELFGTDTLAAQDMGRTAVAVAVVAISLVGVLISLFVPRRPAADPGARFPWLGPFDTLRELWKTRRDPLLRTTIAANTFIWFAGSLQVQLINLLGVKQFGYSKSKTSLLVAVEVLGVAVGGLLSGWLAKGRRWFRVLVPAAVAMAACMGAVVIGPILPESHRAWVLMALFGASGVAGGIFMIPCEAFIQVRPAPGTKGTVIASANFAVFAGVLASGPIANGLYAVTTPTMGFALLGGLSVLVAWALRRALRDKEVG
jgi:hypothetical protein